MQLASVGLDELEEHVFSQVVGAVHVQGDQVLQVSVLHPVLQPDVNITKHVSDTVTVRVHKNGNLPMHYQLHSKTSFILSTLFNDDHKT